MIPLFKVYMDETVDERLKPVLHSGYIGEGEQVKAFTEQCAELLQNRLVLATNSCTSAIEIALRLAGVGPGDTVISTPMTCLATNMPILGLGASVKWADVEPTTGDIDFKSVKETLSNRFGMVKAIVCVHWGGYPCDLGRLRDLAFDYDIPLIEDAAHAWMSFYRHERIGEKSTAACFSFQAIKHLTTVDGGLLAMNNAEDYEKARLMKWFGLDRNLSADMRCTQDPPVVGFKMHMNDIAATIGLANFHQSTQNVYRTVNNAVYYKNELKKLETVRLPLYDQQRKSSYWLFPVLVDDQAAFIEHMKNNNIACSRVHDRNDKKTLFSRFTENLPGVDYFDQHQVNIPVGWWVGEKEREQIVMAIRSYNGNTKHSASCVQSLQSMY